MKKILITGADSYVGVSFEKWIQQTQEFGKYQIDTLDIKNSTWEDFDFFPYDVVFHVAGIAHVDIHKVSEKGKQLYYQVNRDLAIAVAEKYKEDRKTKSSQFIYMSSLIVYGKEKTIHKNTKPVPSNFYGDSKLQAEIGLQALDGNNFHVAIIRPPIIYGPGSKGNYPLLAKIAQKTPIFPDIKNKRSMLFIDNLAEYVRQLIDSQRGGVFFPQNKEYVRTSCMVKEIAKAHGKKIYLFSWANGLIKLLGYFPGSIGKMGNKAFGDLVCDKELNCEFTVPIDFVQSIQETELFLG
ncbi:MAG: NAD-dependent epimerase/dehydratase family protein [Streptococcaceae bacterium]|nr:NAD-dependent epimerase/dehydratase family protein [Streptococcaceae bacterium]